MGLHHMVAKTFEQSPQARAAQPVIHGQQDMQVAPLARVSQRLGVLRHVSQLTVMVLRHMVRRPLRTLVTVFGIAMSLGLLVTSFFFTASTEYMIDVTFFQADRQDASIQLTEKQPARALQAIARLPGVTVAEPYRAVAARLRNGHRSRRIAIIGRAPDTDLSRILDLDLEPVELPRQGIVLTEMLGRLLDVRPGDTVLTRPMLSTRDRLIINTAYRGREAPASSMGTLGAELSLVDEKGTTLSQARSGFA